VMHPKFDRRSTCLRLLASFVTFLSGKEKFEYKHEFV